MTKQHTEDYKLTAVRHYKEYPGATYESTCAIFHCKVRSLKRWVHLLEERETLARKEREKGAYKVKKGQVKLIKDELKKDPDVMIKNIHLKLTDKFPETPLNRQYVHEIIRDKATEMRAFFDVINRYDLKDIITIDETAVRNGEFKDGEDFT